MYERWIKRALDILLAGMLLILLSPIYLLIALAVKLDSPGPILFRQERLGRGGAVFRICKFRSMCVGAEKTGSGVYSGKGDPRVTRVGKFLRASSLDELPQALNVLVGAMSFVGPRPPLTYHPWPFEEYSDEQKRMFSVRPGITGLAQVNGRKNVEWNRRIEMNVWYADHVSFLLDLKICFLTVWKVIRSEDNLSLGETVSSTAREP